MADGSVSAAAATRASIKAASERLRRAAAIEGKTPPVGTVTTNARYGARCHPERIAPLGTRRTPAAPDMKRGKPKTLDGKTCTPARALQSFSRAGANCLKRRRKYFDSACLTFFACLTFLGREGGAHCSRPERKDVAFRRGVQDELYRSQRSQGRTCSLLAPVGRRSLARRQPATGGPRGRQRANDRVATSDRSSRVAGKQGRCGPTPSSRAPLVFRLSKIVMCRLSHGRVVDRDRTQHCARESSQISCKHCWQSAAGSQGRQPAAQPSVVVSRSRSRMTTTRRSPIRPFWSCSQRSDSSGCLSPGATASCLC